MSQIVQVGLAIWPKKAAQWFELGLKGRSDARVTVVSPEMDTPDHPYDFMLIDGDSPGPNFIAHYTAHVQKFGIPHLIVLGQPGCPAMMSVEWDSETTVYIAKPFLIEDVLRTVNRRLDELAANPIPSVGVAEKPKPQEKPAATPSSQGKSLGYLSTLKLADLLQMLCLSNWTGRIDVTNLIGGETGSISIDDGRLHYGKQGQLAGESACHRMLTWGRCEFGFVEEQQGGTPKNIDSSWQEVLLEGARLFDESSK